MLLFVALLSIAYSQEELYMQAGYTVEYFSQPLDHINGDPGLINIKVLIKQGSPDAPLFLYLGGQTNIEFFFNMNGWLPYTDTTATRSLLSQDGPTSTLTKHFWTSQASQCSSSHPKSRL